MSLEINSKAAEIDAQIIDVLRHRVGKDERAAKPHDWYTATVLTLRDFEGYSYQEIAEITDLSVDQVKVYIFRARRFLKQYIGNMEVLI